MLVDEDNADVGAGGHLEGGFVGFVMGAVRLGRVVGGIVVGLLDPQALPIGCIIGSAIRSLALNS